MKEQAQGFDIRTLFANENMSVKQAVKALKDLSDVMPEEASGECAFWRMDIEAAIYWVLVWNRKIDAEWLAPKDTYFSEAKKPLGRFLKDCSKVLSTNYVVGSKNPNANSFRWTAENSFATEERILNSRGMQSYVRNRKDYFEDLTDNIPSDEGYHELRVLNHLRRINDTMPAGHDDWKVAVEFSIKLFELLTRTMIFVQIRPDVAKEDQPVRLVYDKPLCVVVKQIMHISDKTVVYNPRNEYGYEIIDDKMRNPDRIRFDDESSDFVK